MHKLSKQHKQNNTNKTTNQEHKKVWTTTTNVDV